MAFSRSDQDIEDIYKRHIDVVYRVCYSFMGNAADTEDTAQNTFIKAMGAGIAFESEEHEKAWLIRVASNTCKDVLKSSARKSQPLQSVAEPTARSDEFDMTLDAVCRLDAKFTDIVYLYYYEGYTAAQIAKMLAMPASTVRNRLSEAREQLKKTLGGGFE